MLSPFPGIVPAQIGRYAILRRLAVGGMAELFLAKATGIEGFEKHIALKRILPQLAADEEFVHMFLTEARLGAALDHPNIVQVHDIGRDDGDYFFTMEYVHGPDLRRLISTMTARGHGMQLAHALTIITAVAAGLHYAHEQVGSDGRPLGLVHRDVSPSNILVTAAGGIKVADFGIAKAAALGAFSRMSGLKGKAAYMSPEQCKGLPCDRRSDVFAIGLVLFELVTGRPAYEAENDLMLLHRVARGDLPAATQVWPDCPPQLAGILARATAPEVADRYPSALALALDVEAFAHASRIALSQAALGQLVRDVCGDVPLPWQANAPAYVEAPLVVTRTAATRLGAGVATEVTVRKSADAVAEEALTVVRVIEPATRPRGPTALRWVAPGAVLGGGAIAWALLRPDVMFAVSSAAVSPDVDAASADVVADPPIERVADEPVQDADVQAVEAAREPGAAVRQPVVIATPSEPTSIAAEDPTIAPVRPVAAQPDPRPKRRKASDGHVVAPVKPPDAERPSQPHHTRPELPGDDDPNSFLPYKAP